MAINETLREMVIAKMQNGEYKLKPCPFCGHKPMMMSKDFFEELVNENGRACISIECYNCNVELHDHTHDENDYYVRAFIVSEKWNRRVDNVQM